MNYKDIAVRLSIAVALVIAALFLVFIQEHNKLIADHYNAGEIFVAVTDYLGGFALALVVFAAVFLFARKKPYLAVAAAGLPLLSALYYVNIVYQYPRDHLNAPVSIQTAYLDDLRVSRTSGHPSIDKMFMAARWFNELATKTIEKAFEIAGDASSQGSDITKNAKYWPQTIDPAELGVKNKDYNKAYRDSVITIETQIE